MNTNPFLGVLEQIPENLRFAAFLIVFLGATTYLFIGDVRRNRTLSKVVEGNNKMIDLSVRINENLSDQYKLILDLLKRYSDNLSNEQLSPFIMLVYKNLQVRLLKIHVGVKKDYDGKEISLETAEKRLHLDGMNLFKITMQVIFPFKFKGARISKAFCPNDFDRMVDECISQLNHKGGGYSINQSIETIIDGLIIKTTDRLQHEKEGIDS